MKSLHITAVTVASGVMKMRAQISRSIIATLNPSDVELELRIAFKHMINGDERPHLPADPGDVDVEFTASVTERELLDLSSSDTAIGRLMTQRSVEAFWAALYQKVGRPE